MARQKLGKKKLRKYSKLLGITFTEGWVRGNTDHRVDLRSDLGDQYMYWPKDNHLELDFGVRYLGPIQK